MRCVTVSLPVSRFCLSRGPARRANRSAATARGRARDAGASSPAGRCRAGGQSQGRRPPADNPAAIEQAQKDRINAWTVGLAAGRLEGAPLQFASELARVLDDGDNMRVLPIVTRGPFDNVYDLLYLRGVDAAIVYGDVLDHFKAKPEFADAWRRINYLLNLFPSEAHVFVRPEIKLAAGSRRQGGELQHPGHGCRLFRARSSSSSSASTSRRRSSRTVSPWRR